MDLIYGLGWATVFIIAFVGIFVAVVSAATRSYWLASFMVILTIAFTHATQYSILDWIAVNWVATSMWLTIYIALGVVWATFAWFLFLNRKARDYAGVRAVWLPKFLESRGYPQLLPAHHGEFRDFVAKNAQGSLPGQKLQMTPSVMTGQVILWPIKLVSFLLGDAIAWLVRAILSVFGGTFERIQKWVFRKFPELH